MATKQFSPVQKLCGFAEVVITSGQSLSAAFDLQGRVLCGIYMPATWTAAGLTFQASDDGVTYYNIQTATAEYTATAAASQYIALDPVVFYGMRFIKVRSGTAAAAVAQGADRTLVLACGIPTLAQ